jgi:hypothetical protein
LRGPIRRLVAMLVLFSAAAIAGVVSTRSRHIDLVFI